MIDELLANASKLCAQTPSFGEVLNAIRVKRRLTQRQFGNCIFRSEAEVSRLINNQLPQNMKIGDVRAIAASLQCDDNELALLVAAFTCHVFGREDLLDLDIID